MGCMREDSLSFYNNYMVFSNVISIVVDQRSIPGQIKQKTIKLHGIWSTSSAQGCIGHIAYIISLKRNYSLLDMEERAGLIAYTISLKRNCSLLNRANLDWILFLKCLAIANLDWYEVYCWRTNCLHKGSWQLYCFHVGSFRPVVMMLMLIITQFISQII